MEQTNERQIILEQHQKNKDIIKLIFILPNTKPLFYKGKVIKTNSDSFDFDDIIDGVLNFSYENLHSIQVLEKGDSKNGM